MRCAHTRLKLYYEHWVCINNAVDGVKYKGDGIQEWTEMGSFSGGNPTKERLRGSCDRFISGWSPGSRPVAAAGGTILIHQVCEIVFEVHVTDLDSAVWHWNARFGRGVLVCSTAPKVWECHRNIHHIGQLDNYICTCIGANPLWSAYVTDIQPFYFNLSG